MFLLLVCQVPLFDARVSRPSEQKVAHQAQRLNAIVVWWFQIELGTQHSNRVFHYLKYL